MTQKKAPIDMLIDAGCVLTIGWIVLTLIEKVGRLEDTSEAIRSDHTWIKSELGRLHRNQNSLAQQVFPPADEPAEPAAPRVRAVGEPFNRKPPVKRAAKKTTAKKPPARQKAAVA